MAIEKHVTRAIVLESYEQGENDKSYKVFTREFGLLICHAKSIRKLESKLRAHILPRSVSLLTLVRGREVWRLVGAEKEEINSSPFLHEVTTLLRRFIRGEGAHIPLYDRVMSFLLANNTYDEKIMRLVLYYILLVELGYVDAKVIGVKTIEEYNALTLEELYTSIVLTKLDVRKHIQDVLKEMQL